MAKIKLLTDSASDIPDSDLEQYGIELLSIPIAVDGVGYFERKSFSVEEWYPILQNSKEIPVTSKVPERDFLEGYQRAFDEGYTDVIAVTISSTGSGTYDSAVMARDSFYEQNPAAKETFAIHPVDSRNYTIGYGCAVIQAAKMAQEGKAVEEILAYLADWFGCLEIFLGMYTLEYVRKSGRVSGLSAFVGEALGLRPILAMVEGKSTTIDKVRGDKNVVPSIFEAYKKNCADKSAPVAILYGTDKDSAQELADMVEKETGVKAPLYQAGAAVSINSGPRVIALACRGKKRT